MRSRLSPEARAFVADRIRKDNAARAGSTKEHDKRVSPLDSVDSEQLKTNSVDAAALQSHGSNDALRAVTLDHCRESMRGPEQLTPGLRVIGQGLGGSNRNVA